MTAIEAYSSIFFSNMVDLMATVANTWPDKFDKEIDGMIASATTLLAALEDNDEIKETTELKIPKPDCEDVAMFVRKGEMLIVTSIMEDDPISACYAHKALDFLFRLIHGHVCDGENCYDDEGMIMNARLNNEGEEE